MFVCEQCRIMQSKNRDIFAAISQRRNTNRDDVEPIVEIFAEPPCLNFRNQIAAVLLAVGATFVIQIALSIIFTVKEWYSAMKWIPGQLTTNMVITSNPLAGQSVDSKSAAQYFDHWWQAAIVLIVYAAVLSVTGAFLTTRRDVT